MKRHVRLKIEISMMYSVADLCKNIARSGLLNKIFLLKSPSYHGLSMPLEKSICNLKSL